MNAIEESGAIEPLAEPLTRREREILELLAEGLTSPEIAERLTLATSSICWYLRQIYGKLDVNSKRQAVERGRELGLLNTAAPVGQVIPLPAIYPTPKLDVTHNNLPAELSSFIGRGIELKKLRQMLTGNDRLVTLTGAGGTGKTRLALKAAEELLDAFPNGVYLVELAPLSDPGLVLGAMGASLGLHESKDRSIRETVAGYLEHKHLLLILDNCEHLVEECARLVDWLLKANPGLKLLATSREILGVEGEAAMRVPPMELPDAKKPQDITHLAQVEAVQLFVARARQATPEFKLVEDNAVAVTQICLRLDGIPLALELAAARLRMMTGQQVANRLGDVFRLLTGGSRSALPRQQTLKAAMDWSYALLTESEKLMLQRLSVFAGSWSLAAAEAVCLGEGIQDFEVLDLLASLVDKSLVLRGGSEGGEARYRMLETLRQYAHDRLLECGESEAVRDRHLDYYLQLSEAFANEVRGKKQIAWLQRMEVELDNLRLALGWSLERNVLAGLRLGAALLWYWAWRTHRAEGVSWMEKLLVKEALARGKKPLKVGVFSNDYLLIWVRAACLFTFLGGSFASNEERSVEQRRALIEQAIALCRELGKIASYELAWAFEVIQSITTYDSWDEGIRYLEESIQISRQNGYIYLLGGTLDSLYWSYLLDVKENEYLNLGIPYLEESLSLFRQLEDPTGIAQSLLSLSVCTRLQGDYTRSHALLSEALEIYRQTGNLDAFYILSTWHLPIMLEIGENPSDLQLAESAVDYFREKGYESDLCFALIQFSEFEYARGNYQPGEDLAQEACKLSLKVQDQDRIASSHASLALIRCAVGDLADARRLLTIGSTQLADKTLPLAFVVLFISWVSLLAGERKWQQAVKLFGAFNSSYRHFVGYFTPPGREQPVAIQASARQALGEEAFTQAWKEGQALTLWQALELAMQ